MDTAGSVLVRNNFGIGIDGSDRLPNAIVDKSLNCPRSVGRRVSSSWVAGCATGELPTPVRLTNAGRRLALLCFIAIGQTVVDLYLKTYFHYGS